MNSQINIIMLIRVTQSRLSWRQHAFIALSLLFVALSLFTEFAECKGGRGGGRGRSSRGRSSGRGRSKNLGVTLGIIFGILGPYLLFFVIVCIAMKVRKSSCCEAVCCICCCRNCKNDPAEKWESNPKTQAQPVTCGPTLDTSNTSISQQSPLNGNNSVQPLNNALDQTYLPMANTNQYSMPTQFALNNNPGVTGGYEHLRDQSIDAGRGGFGAYPVLSAQAPQGFMVQPPPGYYIIAPIPQGSQGAAFQQTVYQQQQQPQVV
ncbi:hypothetical protein FGO68_gene5376 [Halteria grandinella]|uniref:Uncharacterized protein n=1 Tax=Halteria grandinella TaxID=5974 RepID=A0A8J8NK08_HALGN|nr:hypothetical protein FGO68_gene5376 [Halteria grandinella]